MIPQFILLSLMAMQLGGEFVRHGQVETKKHNFFVTATSAVIELSLFYWAGFFNVFFK